MKFGTTWWGKKWLDAMNYIDNSNRLPRGRAYAKNGNIENMEIKDDILVAKVRGTSVKPYEIYLKLEEFSKEDKEKVMNIIWQNPLFLSKMLAGEMPKDLNERLLEEEISLFPDKWEDVIGACTCPDVAVPCKHIASVIYMIANEIDKNPFIIFKLHGFDIEKELEKLGVESREKTSIKDINEVLNTKFDAGEKRELKQMDYSKIPYLRRDIFEILTKRPLFVSRIDYKRVVEKRYLEIERNLKKHIEEEEIFEGNRISNLDFKFFITDDFENQFLILKENDNFDILKKERLDSLIKSLEKISYKNLENYNDSIKILYSIYRYSLVLMEKGAFIPEIINIAKDSYKIRWIPAMFNGFVRDIFMNIKESLNSNIINIGTSEAKIERLEIIEKLLEEGRAVEENIEANNSIYSIKTYKNLLKEIIDSDMQKESPFDLLFKISDQDFYYNIDEVKAVYPKVKEEVELLKNEMLKKEFKLEKGNELYFPVEEQIFQLVDFFISSFIMKFYSDDFFENEAEINSMFFLGGKFEVKDFTEKEIPKSINLWLNRLHLSLKNHNIILKIEDRYQKFEISILIEEKKKIKTLEFEKIMESKEYMNLRLEVLKDLNIFLEYFPELEIVIKSKGKDKLVKDYNDFEDILFKVIPILQSLGIKMMLPKELENLVRPKLAMTMNKKEEEKTVSYLHLEEMLTFDWKVALGDELIDVEEFKDILKESKGLIKLKSKFVYIDEKEMRALLKNLKNPKISSGDVLKAALDERLDDTKVFLSNNAKSLIDGLLKSDDIEIPNNLNATLRDYQKRGYNWLYKNYKLGLGSLMADDMGLGKTIQIITLLLRLKAEKKENFEKALIVVPTTLITNWKKEIEKFAPSLKVCVYHGLKRELEDEADLLITSYGMVRVEADLLKKMKWELVVIDEAQNIKNPNTDQSKAIKKLKSNYKIALTGTPVENRLTEYWSIFDYINKDYLGKMKAFKKNYAIPIEVLRDMDKLESFKKITSPFIIRRMKTDKTIIKDLPEKIEIDEYCKLSKDQLGLYQNVVDETLDLLKVVKGIERKGLIFKLMTALKQICNHPVHYMKKGQADYNLSGKTKLLVDILERIYESNEKVIIFTQYREMGEILKQIIKDRYQNEVLFFHGGLSREKRDEYIERFQNEKYLKTMVLSLKAGGTGLNLTAASNVIHFDLWWNPAVEAQATDRAYRIGQNKNVMVYRLISENTFEEKINKMIKNKKELADLTVAAGEKWIGDFSDEDLSDLFSIE